MSHTEPMYLFFFFFFFFFQQLSSHQCHRRHATFTCADCKLKEHKEEDMFQTSKDILFLLWGEAAAGESEPSRILKLFMLDPVRPCYQIPVTTYPVLSALYIRRPSCIWNRKMEFTRTRTAFLFASFRYTEAAPFRALIYSCLQSV